jgi:tellurite resistance protein
MYLFDERFAEAFLHEGRAARVLGMRLRPFSYWHKVQLEYVQSKVLLGGAGLWDLWVAAKICGTEYPLNARFRKTYSNLWMLWWHACYGWRNVQREAEKLTAHIADFASPPKLWGGGGGSKERLAEALDRLGSATGQPEMLQRAERLRYEAAMDKNGNRDLDDSIEQVAIYMKLAGRSAEESWNMPMGALLWYNAAFLKMEGSEVPIWTPMDDARFEQHKRQRHEKVVKIAEELRAETPALDASLAYAYAEVRYWEGIISTQGKMQSS